VTKPPPGVLLVDKPSGMTSHDVVDVVRKRASTKKVGHGGTLDPMATGLLVLAVGNATKLLPYLSRGDKDYLAGVRLGITTDSDDADGEVASEKDVPSFTDEELADARGSFLGDITQIPPVYSAIKIRGKRAHARARAGESVEMEPRKVRIESFDILGSRLPEVDVRIRCSGGTYIRALARDWGDKLGVGAHICGLRRLASGLFSVDKAANWSDLIDEKTPLADVRGWLCPAEALETALGPALVLETVLAEKFLHGQEVIASGDDREEVPVLAHDGRLLGIGQCQLGDRLRPRRIMSPV